MGSVDAGARAFDGLEKMVRARSGEICRIRAAIWRGAGGANGAARLAAHRSTPERLDAPDRDPRSGAEPRRSAAQSAGRLAVVARMERSEIRDRFLRISRPLRKRS